ncbi:ABC transporter ATP-binding protein [Pleomorphovibrio marinus]|uniref:ABC transporter ATP-binding protein n=1 Tax=Pleomorphovibrio marinus TaxID=2164132 RepID=UPI000E0C7156|nr:ABC transporter ATP-binding protein [Pleomorphovibrio marinus]
MSLVIKVENLSKAYQLGELGTGTLSRDLERWIAKLRGKEDPFLQVGETNDREKKGRSNIVWSLKDLNFEINQGDTVGIIGRNGAGKSTLLKLLSRVTSPTKGEINVKGRIASLLEVGTGFHPELTGRENIYLNGAILGMRKKEITRKFDEIVDFAGVERYIDTPVKRYSSGMYVRLAFAVAAHLESEILIVDEVLAVGDAEFQKKCLGKMGDISKLEGRTILFVSHNMQAIKTLTRNCLLLKSGKLIKYDETDSIINAYNDLEKNKNLTYRSESSIKKPKITKIDLSTSLPNNVHVNGEDLIIKIEVSIPVEIKSAWLSLQIKDSNDKVIVHVWTSNNDQPFFDKSGNYKIKCTLPKCQLYMGDYTLDLYISGPPGGETYEILQDVCPLEIVMFNKNREWPWRKEECTYLADSNWEIIRNGYEII